jgi:hypothetical protein
MTELVYYIGGIVVTIIGYFLKTTMEELKEVKQMAIETKSKLEVVENDHKNKYAHLSDKLDELYIMVKDLIIEVKELNKKIK